MRSKLFYLPAIILITSTFQSCGLFKTATERNLTYRSVGNFPSKTPPAPPVMFPKDGKNEANLSRSADASAMSAIGIVSMAKTYIGTPYLSGGTTKEGADCSGLVYACFSAAGLKIPRTSRDLADFGTPVENKSDIRMGDLVFFDSNNAGKINHVGMVSNVEITDVNFIHASSSKGVIESALTKGYWLDKHRKTVRILPVDDSNNPAKYKPSAVVTLPKKDETSNTKTPNPSVPPKKETATSIPKKETAVSQPKTTQTPKNTTKPSQKPGTSTNVAKPAPKKEDTKVQPKRLENKVGTDK